MRQVIKPYNDAESYNERKKELNGNKLINKPIQKLDNSVLKRKGKSGRPKRYTPQRMLNQINKYFKWCEDTDSMPSIGGMMVKMKMYGSQFYEYLQYPEYTDMLEQARLTIKTWIEDDVYSTQGRTEGKIAYMKNVHAWTDRLETKNETEVKHVVSVDEARAKIEMLAPLLLDVLNSPSTVNQIAHDAEIIEDE